MDGFIYYLIQMTDIQNYVIMPLIIVICILIYVAYFDKYR